MKKKEGSKSKRFKIPQKISNDILFRSDRKCCLCHQQSIRPQIHHIDGNPSNNDLDNLIPLCPNCHSDVEQKGGSGRGWTPGLLKKYRDEWFKDVANYRKIEVKSISNKDKFEILSALLAQYDVRRIAYQIEKANLKRSSNARFGFSYMESRTWDRFDPMNGDGNLYVHPTKADIKYSVSGINDEFDEDEIETAIESHLNYLKKIKGFELILSSPSGSYLYDYTDANVICEQKIEGWRLKYKLTDKISKKRLTVLEFKCYYDGVCFTVYCQAPEKEIDYFEDFFLYLISEFRVLGKKSAPFARS